MGDVVAQVDEREQGLLGSKELAFCAAAERGDGALGASFWLGGGALTPAQPVSIVRSTP